MRVSINKHLNSSTQCSIIPIIIVNTVTTRLSGLKRKATNENIHFRVFTSDRSPQNVSDAELTAGKEKLVAERQARDAAEREATVQKALHEDHACTTLGKCTTSCQRSWTQYLG
jgi:hypothetical protein